VLLLLRLGAPDRARLVRRDEVRDHEADEDAEGEAAVEAEEDLGAEAQEREEDRDRDPFRRIQRSEHAYILICPGNPTEERMAAYVIVDIDITDPLRYEEYRKLAGPTVAAHGGKYVARGGKVTTLEGDWRPGRIVVLEFPSAEKAKAWWDAADYRKARAIRHESAKSRMIVVEGV
jgi:uncharacterized protein (DUF1330 family)